LREQVRAWLQKLEAGDAKAVEYLTGKFDFSSRVMAQTGPSLTALSWDLSVLTADIKAVSATIANEFVPELRKIANVFHVSITSWGEIVGKAIAAMMRAALDFAMNTLLGSGSIIFKYIGKAVLALLPTPENIGPPTAAARRLPGSAWEKMGLVIGQGPNSPAERTAKNTQKTAELLAQFLGLNSQIPRSGGGYNPQFAQP